MTVLGDTTLVCDNSNGLAKNPCLNVSTELTCEDEQICTFICKMNNACDNIIINGFYSKKIDLIMLASNSANSVTLKAPVNGSVNIISHKNYYFLNVNTNKPLNIIGNINTSINITCIGDYSCHGVTITGSRANTIHMYCGAFKTSFHTLQLFFLFLFCVCVCV